MDISGKYLGEKMYFQIKYVWKSHCCGKQITSVTPAGKFNTLQNVYKLAATNELASLFLNLISKLMEMKI